MRLNDGTKININGHRFRVGMSLAFGLVSTSAALGDGPLPDVSFAAAPHAHEAKIEIPASDNDGQNDLGQDLSDRLQPIPKSYRVQEHYADRYAGRVAGTRGEVKVIYSNTSGQFLFRPGRGALVADDMLTTLVNPCTVNTLRLRVTGGVEGGGGVFLVDVILHDGCPWEDDGVTGIPGTHVRFRDLDDDLELLHDLVLDYSDRGICKDETECRVSLQDCGDVSACQHDPIQIPPKVWVQFRFDTDTAAVVAGSPATIGFSTDAYDDLHAPCKASFNGWPTFSHASFWVEMTAPAECESYVVAYSAADPNRPRFLPTDIGPPNVGRPTTRLGDDIRLSFDDCILGAFELGMKGFSEPTEMSIDLRWPSILDVIPETVRRFSGSGARLDVVRFTIPPEIALSIDGLDQPIYITWAADKSNTGVLEVDVAQVGESGPEFFAFDTDPNNPDTWDTLFEPSGSPAVFYASVFCRVDTPHGACCPDQPDMPGLDMNCFDDVPATSCVGGRWQINATCEENSFNPPCGTHSCCLPSSICEDRTFDDCVEECITDMDPIFCEPVCNGGENNLQPCNPAIGDADCEPDGKCDPHESCPGKRTCGLTGCQLNGVFTGRPCELDSPDQGAADCMTCSRNGEYCRPRCADGLRRGRPCDDNTDCPGSTCDTHADCLTGQRCESIQTCAHDANQCDLRCARWSEGKFCNENGFEEDCLFDPGACCLGATCSIEPEFNCLESGGTFFGAHTACDAPDTDSDGLRDECDRCPDDFNKIEPGICGCGVIDVADLDKPLLLGKQYAAASKPISVAIGDLNGDQVPDLAVANLLSDNVSVLLGIGDGTFTTAMHYTVANGPRSIAIADLDGDQVSDLAVANLDSDNVSVLLGVGGGTFAAAVHYAAGDEPASIAIGDLDGDQVPDVTVANLFSNNVSVMLGVGDGTFAVAIPYAAGDRVRSVAIGDLDRDQVPDLAVANLGSGSVSVLLGHGDGTFAVAIAYAAGDFPFFVAIGDLNGDRVPDLALVSIISDEVSVMLGVGDGTFRAAMRFATGKFPTSLAIGDLDGDQIPDLVVANGNSGNVSLLLGVGDGTFAVASTYTAGHLPFSVAIGDLDGDELPDLAVANEESNTVSVLLNQSDCNHNGIPDACDNDCGPPGGPCDLPCCGERVDCNGNGVPDDCEVDGDGDGFIDDCDACLDSDLAKLIVLNECPTGVTNALLDDGCTMNDVLTECSAGAHSSGELTACVARQANEWRRQGLLYGKDVGRITHCAGTSNDPKPSKRIKDVSSHGGR